MSYDHGLVERVRDAIVRLSERGTREKNVFGGWGFLLGSNAFAIAWDEGLLVKMAPDEYAAAASRPSVTPFAPMAERPMGTWLVAGDDATADDLELLEWVRSGLRGVRAAPVPKVKRAAAATEVVKARPNATRAATSTKRPTAQAKRAAQTSRPAAKSTRTAQRPARPAAKTAARSGSSSPGAPARRPRGSKKR